MAVKTDINVSDIKAKLHKQLLNTSRAMLTDLKDKHSALIYELSKLCENHLESDFNSVNVGKIVTEKGNTNIKALQLIHTALFEIQNVSSITRVRLYPKLVDIYKTAILLYNRCCEEVLNHSLLEDCKSNAERERVKDYVMSEMTQDIDTMKMKDIQMESYISYIKDQMYHLNSLDTMVRTVDKMESSEVFTDSLDTLNLNTDKKVFNQDGSVEDNDSEEDWEPDEKPIKKNIKREAPVDLDDLEEI